MCFMLTANNLSSVVNVPCNQPKHSLGLTSNTASPLRTMSLNSINVTAKYKRFSAAISLAGHLLAKYEQHLRVSENREQSM